MLDAWQLWEASDLNWDPSLSCYLQSDQMSASCLSSYLLACPPGMQVLLQFGLQNSYLFAQ